MLRAMFNPRRSCSIAFNKTALAAGGGEAGTQVLFTMFSDDDSALVWEEIPGMGASQYGANEQVRVSVVLEEPSVMEKGYVTQALAENRAAMTYRAQRRPGIRL